jgi:hypothetical protein
VIPTEDAVVPVAFTVTNTTQDFPTPISIQFESDQEANGNGASFDFMGQCIEQPARSYPALQSNTAFSEGQSLSGDFYVMLASLYSPTTPDGDMTRIRNDTLAFKIMFGSQASPTFSLPFLA